MFIHLQEAFSSLEPGEDLGNLTTIGSIAAIIANVMIGAGFSIAIIGIAYSAVQYIMSRGDPKNISAAWNSFLWSTIAAIVGLAVLVIKAAILNAFGVVSPEIQNNVPSF